MIFNVAIKKNRSTNHLHLKWEKLGFGARVKNKEKQTGGRKTRGICGENSVYTGKMYSGVAKKLNVLLGGWAPRRKR